MNKNLLKLRKMILALKETETDKGRLISEGELAEGTEVFVEDEKGELVPPADGEYATESQIIVVAEGRVTEIKEKDAKPEIKQVDEKDARIAELEADLAECEAEKEVKEKALEAKAAEVDEKDARIAELEAELEDLKAKLAESDARSAEEELKMSKQNPQKNGLRFDLFNNKK